MFEKDPKRRMWYNQAVHGQDVNNHRWTRIRTNIGDKYHVKKIENTELQGLEGYIGHSYGSDAHCFLAPTAQVNPVLVSF